MLPSKKAKFTYIHQIFVKGSRKNQKNDQKCPFYGPRTFVLIWNPLNNRSFVNFNLLIRQILLNFAFFIDFYSSHEYTFKEAYVMKFERNVVGEKHMNIDYQLFKLVNQFAGQNDLLDLLVSYFSKLGPVLFVLVFAWLWFTNKGNQYENRQLVLFALSIAVITIGINKVIELSVFRERPFVNYDVNLLSDKSVDDPSFPSNHAGGAFALAIAMFWKHRKMGAVFLVFALFMALSRLYIGVHFPLDVTVGAFIALIVALFFIWQQGLFEKPFKWVIETYEGTLSRFIK